MGSAKRWGGGIVLCLLLTACGEGSAVQHASVRRDSAGVALVESTSDSLFRASWTIGDSAVWSVGAVEGSDDRLLDRVVGAMKLSDGDILVGNGGSSELRIYDRSGRLVQSLGREGEGPGEFEYLRALGRCRSDGFVGFDLNWQMNIYEEDGTFVEKTVLQTPDGITPYNLACDPHGHVLMLGWGRETQERPIGFYETWDRLLLTTPDGAVVTDFGSQLVSERLGSAGGSRPHPAGRATKFALHDDLVYVGSGERFEIEVRGLDGSLRSVIRGPDLTLEVTDSLKAAYLEAALARARPEQRPAIRRQVAEWEWPERVPAFTELRVDREGVVWLQGYHVDPSRRDRWSLFHPERGYLGDVYLSGGELLEAGTDYLLVLATDELGVQRVMERPLRRMDGS